ncbi:Protein ECERIFERUM 26 [Linum perenne]
MGSNNANEESSTDHQVVYNIKISSVGPGRATPEGVEKEQDGVDLAMKMHYLKGIYFFNKDAAIGITTTRIKESMFYLFNDYYLACGRFRRSSSARPYLKCNDCGVRFVEAECRQTVEEWIRDNFSGKANYNNNLVYHLPIGPHLFFSPPVYLQVTKFKCGGMSFGLSWAHVIGDFYSTTDLMNSWGKFLHGLKSNIPFQHFSRPIYNTLSDSPKAQNPNNLPLSLKRVNSVGDNWVSPNHCKMDTISFRLTAPQVVDVHNKITGTQIHTNSKITIFESIIAAMWQSISKIREGTNEPRRVTICNKDYDSNSDTSQNVIIDNSRVAIRFIMADFSVANTDLSDLTKWLSEKIGNSRDEKHVINEEVEKDIDGVWDYIVYGGNLTFVDFGGTDLYGLECNGYKPKFVHYEVGGVGDEGAVIVLPWPKSVDKDGNEGRVVTVILPENEVGRLKFELNKIGLCVEANTFEL